MRFMAVKASEKDAFNMMHKIGIDGGAYRVKHRRRCMERDAQTKMLIMRLIL